MVLAMQTVREYEEQYLAVWREQCEAAGIVAPTPGGGLLADGMALLDIPASEPTLCTAWPSKKTPGFSQCCHS